MRFFYVILFYSFSAVVLHALSQTGKQVVSSLELYTEGEKFYRAALVVSEATDYDESTEEKLNRQALEKLTAFLNAASAGHHPADLLQLRAAIMVAELEHYFENLQPALDYYNTAIAIKQKLPTVSDTVLFKPYIFAGLIYYTQNKLDSSRSYLKEAEKIQATSPHRLQEAERLFNVLGSIYFEYGNYKQAKNYFQKAGEVLTPDNPAYQTLRVNYQINLASALFKLEDYDAARSIYIRLLNDGDLYRNQIYNNLGLIEFYSGAPEQAVRYFKEVSYTNHLQVGLYNDVAGAYFKMNALDSAEVYLQKSDAAFALYSVSGASVDYGRTLKLRGDLHSAAGRFNEALQSYQQAIHHFYPAFKDSSSQTNPAIFSGVFSYINLFHTLVAKAATQHEIYTQSHEITWAEKELSTYEAAFRLMEYVEKTYDSDEARLFLTKIKYAVHNKPIDIAFELYKHYGDKKFLETLYRFDQQNKAAILSLNRRLNTELAERASPLLQKERNIRQAVTRLSLSAPQIKDSAMLAATNKTIRDYEIQLGKVQEEMQQSMKNKDEQIPSIPFLQNQLLDDKTALLSYHLAPDKLTTIVITKKEIDCYQAPLPKNFYVDIEAFIREVKNPGIFGHQAAYYSLLFSHVPVHQMEQLIIIPDDVLHYLPFECLRNAEGKYLIEQVAVQYQASTALLHRNSIDFSWAETLSFAPFAHRSLNDSLATLPSSGAEIATLPGEKFLDSAATKKSFLARCTQYPILHLATHAAVNAENENLSYIAFATSGKDSLLYAQEIYTLPLQNTGLVVLSACETGAGQLVKGEGVMSLSRAFAYAGCPNIVTSLWKADDFSTAYLTTRIHQYLSQGEPLAKAVQKAKTNYLHDPSIHPRLKQPYYWSHLIFIGDYSPRKSFSLFWVVVVLFLGAGLVFLLIRSLSKETQHKEKTG